MKRVLRLPWLRLLGALVLTVITFPQLDTVTMDSVDGSLAWAFNHLYSTGLEQGTHITFPHGPLAFIMYPRALGGDLLAALAIILAIVSVFHFTMLSLGANTDVARPAFTALLSALLAIMLQPNAQLVFITGTALLLHYRTRSWPWAALGVISALVALHVRAHVGIISVSLLITHAGLLVWRRKEWRTVFTALLGFVVAAILLRWSLYGSLAGLGTYYTGLFELARASSAATSLHPPNNWWCIGGAVALFIAVPLFVKDKDLRHTYLLFGPALFAAWKHGITREEIYHARGLFGFVLTFLLLVLLAWRNQRALPLLAMAGVILLGYRALAPIPYYGEVTLRPFGVNHLHQWVFSRTDMVNDAVRKSRQNMANYTLPDTLVARLRTGTVDAYPWEFTYLAANDLSWRPRPVLQSYASYTTWLDNGNARHFQEGRGADRIIWHFEQDRFGGRMSSVDDRYLLNDEPMAILAMLDRYEWTALNDRIALLEKAATPRLGPPTTFSHTTAEWDTWIPVPQHNDGIIRVNVDIERTAYRTVKDFLYKDAVYEIVYQLADDRTYTYRIVPENAHQGLWVAPLILDPASGRTEPEVTAIRFHCSEQAMVKPTIGLQWVHIPLLQPGMLPTELFGSNLTTPGERPSPLTFNMESTDMPHWTWSGQDATDSLAHSGSQACLLQPEAFSPTASMPLDSLSTPLFVRASAWVRADDAQGAMIAISVEVDGKAIYWVSADLTLFIHGPNEWWHVHLDREVPTGPGRVLRVYVWNKGKEPILVDDMRVEFPYGPAAP